jgi:hypothetical protein
MQKMFSRIKSLTRQISIAHKSVSHVITVEAKFPTPLDPVNETVRLSGPVERT